MNEFTTLSHGESRSLSSGEGNAAEMLEAVLAVPTSPSRPFRKREGEAELDVGQDRMHRSYQPEVGKMCEDF